MSRIGRAPIPLPDGVVVVELDAVGQRDWSSTDPRDDPFPALAVLELDDDDLAVLTLLGLVADDVALLGLEPSDLDLHPGRRDLDGAVPSRAAVADAGQHVGDGVRH